MSKDNEKTGITIELNEENIRKAYEVIGLPMEENDLEKCDTSKEALVKSEDGEEKEEKEGAELTEKEGREKKKKEGEKEEKEAGEVEEKEEEEDVEKSKDTPKIEEKKEGESKEDEEKEDEKEEEKNEIKKSFESGNFPSPDIIKSFENLLQKQSEDLNQKVLALGLIEKSISGKLDDINNMLSGVDVDNEELRKGLSEAQITIERLTERLKKVEEQPGIRKSILSRSFVERDFDKGIDGNEDDRTVLDVKKDRRAILDILKSKSGFDTDSPREDFTNALLKFESAGTIHKDILAKLAKDGVYIR